MAKINYKINISGIGPHKALSFDEVIPSQKTVIYANNGSGKTFISRVFRLIDEPSIENVTKLISFGKLKGQFELEINNSADSVAPKRKLTVKLTRDNEPTIENETGYIFHTFNSAYVKENIEVSGYTPEDNIKGYIVGKSRIDLSKEKQELQDKEGERDEKKGALEKNVDALKEELDTDELKINKNTKEYRDFTLQSVFDQQSIGNESNSFVELKNELTNLKSLPDDLSDVPALASLPSKDILIKIAELLKTEYTKSLFAEEFKNKVKPKRAFVEAGIELVDVTVDENCPFCEQQFNGSVLELLNQYINFLDDEESKTLKTIDGALDELKKLTRQLKESYSKFLETQQSYNELKAYFPSLEDVSLESVSSPEELDEAFETIRELLEEKKGGIESSLSCKDVLDEVKYYFETTGMIGKRNNTKATKINSIKNDLTGETLSLKKRICVAKHQEALDSVKESVAEIKLLDSDILTLGDDIKTKEDQERVSKKDKFIETFEGYLNVFFAGKYNFDKEAFCLTFKTHVLTQGASDVLSDGEKSIVSFCLYLAQAHAKVDNEDEYNKLYFVIDDPISSLDFHYVYSVAQIIRNLSQSFPKIERPKFLILTHNLEFLSILSRNKIVDNTFTLDNGEINKLNKKLVMPYEEHLSDIYQVSRKEKSPSHTTPNSIRHVLETMNKFENPNLDFLDYCEAINLLDEAGSLYSLMHDNSHGNIRNQIAYTDEMIVSGCKQVIKIISSKFEGQIKVMEQPHA